MTLRFTVNGTAEDAEPRTTVAAALLNAGVVNFRQSVRGEPRAPLCAMGVCHECRVTIDGVAHRRSCLVEVQDGMAVETAIAAPRAMIQHDVEQFDADVVVIGGGPAGIAAAVSAAERGTKVILIDEGNRAGGQIWRHRDNMSLTPEAQRWLLRLERTSTRILNGATVSSIQRSAEQFVLTCEQSGQALTINAAQLVLATGARELFLPFPGSTLPGVLGVGALQALLKSGLTVRNARIVIAGTGPLLMPVAAAAARAGAKLLLVAEQAPLRNVARFASGLWRHPSSLVQAAQYRAAFRSTPYAMNTWVTRAEGDDRVRSVVITDGVKARTIECDYLAVAHGLIPNTEVARHLGCATLEGAVLVDEYQHSNVSGVYCAGELTGVAGVDLAIVEGMVAGLAASGARTAADAHIPLVRSLRAMAQRMTSAFALRDELRGLARPDSIVCRCEDVTMSAIRLGWTMRKAKLYSRAGMGACQGRTCGAALEFLTAAGADSVRLPVQPAQLTTLTTLTAVSTAVHNDLGEPHDG